MYKSGGVYKKVIFLRKFDFALIDYLNERTLDMNRIINKFFAVILMVTILSSIFLMPSNAAEAGKMGSIEDVEIVILLDVSGSMNYSDPKIPVKRNELGVTEEKASENIPGSSDRPDHTRRSIEACEILQFLCNSSSDILGGINTVIKIIPFNDAIYSGFAPVDITTAQGSKNYKKQLNTILTDTDYDTYMENLNTYKKVSLEKLNEYLDTYKSTDKTPDIFCWSSVTNIAQALEAAYDSISESDASQKAVILFTDGRNENGSGGSASEIVEWDERSYAAADKLKEEGISLFTIALNAGKANGIDSIDKDFIAKLYGSDDISSCEDVRIIEKSEQIMDAFMSLVEGIYGVGSQIEQGKEDEKVFELSNKTPIERKIKVYNDIVKNVFVVISSQNEITGIQVLDPEGKIVSDIDIFAENRIKDNPSICEVDYTESKRGLHVSIPYPQGGEWTLKITGEKGTAIQTNMYMIDLDVWDNITSDTIYVEDALEFETAVRAKNDAVRITDAGIYLEEDNSSAELQLMSANQKNGPTYQGRRNEDGTGYAYKVSFKKPGEYLLKNTIKHDKYSATSEKVVTVVGPNVDIKPVALKNGIQIDVTLTHPVTEEKLDNLPEYLSGQVLEVVVEHNGKKENIKMQFEKGSMSEEYIPPVNGSYSFKAVFSSGNTVTFETAPVTVDFEYPKLVPINFPDEFGGSNFSGKFNAYVELPSSTEDGRKLSYTVTSIGDNIVAEEKDGKLEVTVNGFTSGEVTVVVSDGRGQEDTYIVPVSVKSLRWLIVLAVIVVLAAAAAVVLFIFIQSASNKLNLKFNLYIDNPGTGHNLRYELMSLKVLKNVKHKMTLAELLTADRTGSKIVKSPSSTMDDTDYNNFIGNIAPNVFLQGTQKGKQLIISTVDPKSKKKRKWGTFTNRTGAEKTIIVKNSAVSDEIYNQYQITFM